MKSSELKRMEDALSNNSRDLQADIKIKHQKILDLETSNYRLVKERKLLEERLRDSVSEHNQLIDTARHKAIPDLVNLMSEMEQFLGRTEREFSRANSSLEGFNTLFNMEIYERIR